MTEHYKDSIFSSFYYIFSKNHIEDYNDCIKLTDRLNLGDHNYNLGRFVIKANTPVIHIPNFLSNRDFTTNTILTYNVNVLRKENSLYSSVVKIPYRYYYCFQCIFRNYKYYISPGFIFDKDGNILVGTYRELTLNEDNHYYNAHPAKIILKLSQNLFNRKDPLSKLFLDIYVPKLCINSMYRVEITNDFQFYKNNFEENQIISLDKFNENANNILKLAVGSNLALFNI